MSPNCSSSHGKKTRREYTPKSASLRSVPISEQIETRDEKTWAHPRQPTCNMTAHNNAFILKTADDAPEPRDTGVKVCHAICSFKYFNASRISSAAAASPSNMRREQIKTFLKHCSSTSLGTMQICPSNQSRPPCGDESQPMNTATSFLLPALSNSNETHLPRSNIK